MSSMNLEIYDALIQSKFPEKPARTIAVVLEKETKKEAREVNINLSKEIREAKKELKAEIQEVKAELRGEIQGVKTELKAEIQEVKVEIQGVRGDIIKLQKEMLLVKWMLGLIIIAVVIPLVERLF